MATNKELSDQILTVASKLGKTVDLNGLNNEKLSSLLDSLNTEASAAPPAPAAPAPSEEDVTAKAEAAAKARAAEAAEENRLRAEASKAAADGTAEFKVAPGMSITCKRGVVDENQPVFAADFHGKEKDLQDLAERGAIVKAK